eukprot:TRINITY_DN5231_c0_g1_i1.p1 TRINITY_DN5231_c0_g1~~TRINITY_DN5231_c0_g1_i1.p1  ORF type:complete len:311 (+),score=62.11 TRINITY_DN5231_c0_g1_i1:124-1056(+)
MAAEVQNEARARQVMPHVPKKATQNGLFRSSQEEAPPTLKPGQTVLKGNDIYMQEAQPYRETYLTQDQVRDSVYTVTTSRATLPEDYINPARPYQPPTLRGAGDLLNSGTVHWQSEYKASLHKEPLKLLRDANNGFGGADHLPQGKPRQTAPRGCGTMSFGLGRTADASTYTGDFGKAGTDPRDRLPPGSTQLPFSRTVLSAGTTKGTRHVPGYQGFIPANLINKEVARSCEKDVASEERVVDKTNMEQIYHVNLVGYCGHVPASARNDRGGRKTSDLTVFDRDFITPRTGRMKEMAQRYLEDSKGKGTS